MFPDGFKHYDQRSGMFRHTCPMCGDVFLSRRRSGVKFCGSTCRKRASDGHKKWVTSFKCAHCGGIGSLKQPFQHKKYCSNACRQAAYRARRS